MTFELVRKVSEQEVMSASALNDLRQTALTCRGHTRPVTYLAFSDVTADGYFLASACKDGRAMLRLGSTGDWIGTLEKHKGAVWCVAINSLATRGVTASADHTVKIWDLLNGNEIHQLDHKGIVKSVAMSKNSNRIITCGQDRNLLMYRLDRIGQNSPEEFEGPEVGSRHVIYGSTEREIYVASEDGGLTLTDLRTGSIVSTHTFPDVIKDLRFNPCDKNSLLLCHGLQADVWDTRTQSVSKTFKLNSGVLSGDFHPSEQVVTLGCDDHKLYKYSTLDTEQFEISRGHFGPIHAVRYSPDGELIASGSEDGTVRLWQHNVGKTYGLWRGICPTASTPSTPRYNTSAPPFFPSSATGIMCNGVEKVNSSFV
ncbi:serine-threonine kinase receptor-associated protein-like [Convolutriloba macropyga]|uniref:serine-threonine kinase receptor-associated protein-like n=1 Tax=Convolutriloba macropyga TaxID=536237 RepID=UPI003F522B53